MTEFDVEILCHVFLAGLSADTGMFPSLKVTSTAQDLKRLMQVVLKINGEGLDRHKAVNA